MQVIILAAGRGARLSPLTDAIPKPLLHISGKPILKRLLESLPEKVTDIIIVIGYKGDLISNYFGDNFNNKKITYVEQGGMIGTYGALLSARPYLNTEPFLVMGADDIQDKESLEEITKHSLAFGIHKKLLPTKDYLIVDVHRNFIRGMRRPTDVEFEESQPMATGIYMLNNHIWKYGAVEVKGGEYGLPQTLRQMFMDHDFTAVEMKNWLQVNSHEELAYAETELTKIKKLL